MIDRNAPTKAIPALPPNFAKNFIEGGWRQLERVYGCRDDVILAWMAMCGGVEAMQQRRGQYIAERKRQAEAALRPRPRMIA